MYHHRKGAAEGEISEANIREKLDQNLRVNPLAGSRGLPQAFGWVTTMYRLVPLVPPCTTISLCPAIVRLCFYFVFHIRSLFSSCLVWLVYSRVQWLSDMAEVYVTIAWVRSGWVSGIFWLQRKSRCPTYRWAALRRISGLTRNLLLKFWGPVTVKL